MNLTDSRTDWVVGDITGLQIPAQGSALLAGGETFLTAAFHASGTLNRDNRVAQITEFQEFAGGSTGRKALLSVRYAAPSPRLHTQLFVKFSRDFEDTIRDQARGQMETEVHLASLSRLPEFPIAVPACLFADYHHQSGTGILITQRIFFETDGIERHYEKCRDYEIPAMLEHYRALIRALARLAGTHKSGRLAPEVIARQFPFDPDRLAVSQRTPYTAQQLQNRVARLAEFTSRFPQLLPPEIASATFIARLRDEVAAFPAHEAGIKQLLHRRPELVALCHWNANIDNAWFWRHADGQLECGLMDWGHVSQMNIAMALWGAMSAAEIELWDDHLDELLTLFDQEYRSCGGPAFDMQELQLHLDLYIALMGLAWLLDVPASIQRQIPDLADMESRFDPRLVEHESARTRLQMMTTFLHLWQRRDFPGALRRYLSRSNNQ
jgi:hypothetical protein